MVLPDHIGAVSFLPYLFPRKVHWSIGLVIAYVPLTIAVVAWTILDKADVYDAYRGYMIHFISVLGGVAFYRYGVFDKVRALLDKIKLDQWWFYLIASLAGLAVLGIFRRGLTAPFALLPSLFLTVSLFEGRAIPKWLDFGLSWLGMLSMPLWFIHYMFFAGYVNQIIPLFDFVSSVRVGVVIVLLALLMCVPIALTYHFIFFGVRRLAICGRRNSLHSR